MDIRFQNIRHYLPCSTSGLSIGLTIEGTKLSSLIAKNILRIIASKRFYYKFSDTVQHNWLNVIVLGRFFR